jgi:hypothetical protein
VLTRLATNTVAIAVSHYYVLAACATGSRSGGSASGSDQRPAEDLEPGRATEPTGAQLPVVVERVNLSFVSAYVLDAASKATAYAGEEDLAKKVADRKVTGVIEGDEVFDLRVLATPDSPRRCDPDPSLMWPFRRRVGDSIDRSAN